MDKPGVKGRVAFFFAWPDKVTGEEAESDGVFGGFGFSGFCARAGGGLRVGDVGCDLSC